MIRAADIDPTRAYRYRLYREWGEGKTALFVMLNPSTADADLDDPTIRRCIGFARDWGYGALEIANLFALRATDPKSLYSHPEPLGELADSSIRAAHLESDLTVAAWGVHGALRGRGAAVLEMLHGYGRPVHCLGLTKGGHPKHPLYLPRSLRPIEITHGGAR